MKEQDKTAARDLSQMEISMPYREFNDHKDTYWA